MARDVTINGIITGSDSTHVTFINAIDALANGKQVGKTFVSSKVGIPSRTFFIDDFDWVVDKADVSKISYTLTLKEGDSIDIL